MEMSISKNTTPVPEQVNENVARYLEQHNLGTLVKVYRASEYLVDDYLYHVIALKGHTYSVWTSWNETTQCLNHGHYGLTLAQAVEVHYNFFRTLSGQHMLYPGAKKALSQIFSEEFAENLLSARDGITENTFLEDVTGHFFEEMLKNPENIELEFSELSSFIIICKCIEKELAARLGVE